MKLKRTIMQILSLGFFCFIIVFYGCGLREYLLDTDADNISIYFFLTIALFVAQFYYLVYTIKCPKCHTALLKPNHCSWSISPMLQFLIGFPRVKCRNCQNEIKI